MKILIALFIAAIGFSACNAVTSTEVKTEKNYEKAKENIEETEQKSPSKFLSAEGDKKKNLLGQTVVKGSITNHAKMVSFKDVDVKLSFYSKTGTLLEEDHEMVYETVAPGETIKFKTKYFTPKGTDSLALVVMGAKY